MALKWILLFTFLFTITFCTSDKIWEHISNINKRCNMSIDFFSSSNFKQFCNYDTSYTGDTVCLRVLNVSNDSCNSISVLKSLNNETITKLKTFFMSTNENICEYLNKTYSEPLVCKYQCYDFDGVVNPLCLFLLRDKLPEILKRIPKSNSSNYSGTKSTLENREEEETKKSKDAKNKIFDANNIAQSDKNSNNADIHVSKIEDMGGALEKENALLDKLSKKAEVMSGKKSKNDANPISEIDDDKEENAGKLVKFAQPEELADVREEIRNVDKDDSAEESHVFTYLFAISLLLLVFYLISYNKKRIMALIIEGRRSRSKRRRNSPSYSRLNCNLEEAMISETSVPAANNSFPY